MLQKILSQRNKIRLLTDMAFDAIDLDGSGGIDKMELKDTMKEVAK